MAINFPENYKKDLVKGFNIASETDALVSHEMDMEFSGVRTVHTANILTEKLNDYNRSVDPTTGSRYGAAREVQDEVQTYEMQEDKSLSLTIDKGNAKEQFNWKKAGDVMNREKEDVIVPYLDTYRMKAWAEKAGIHKELTGTLSKANIAAEIIEAHNDVLEHGVPDNLVLCIARKHLPALKLADEWIKLENCGGKSLPSGSIGEFDGMPVKAFTSAKMPANVAFMLIYKGSVIAPIKIQDMKAHMDPPGLSGDLLEFRLIQDAFVVAQKAYGVLAACEKGKVCKDVTFSGGASTITFASTTGGAAFHYTTDGSDPRYSDSVQTGATCELEVGQTVRAYCTKAEMYGSGVTEFTRV